MIQRSHKRITVCLVLLCLNLAFIWGNSLLPGEISGTISQWLKDLINWLPESDPDQSHGLLRKLAHFTEFTCLGGLLSCLIRMMRTKKAEHIGLPMAGGFLAACIDETIQCFVPDRGPSIVDVGIDTLGVGLGVVILCGILHQKQKLKEKET